MQSTDIVAIAALVISLAAFFTTTLQVLQQYLASAEGFRRCAPSVMGLWHVGTKRKFRRHELRFEVVFETPVLFLAPPSNKRGPIEGRPIFQIDGTDKSYKNTNTMKPEEVKFSNVSTADDEQASWVTLLSVLQRVEFESRKWDHANRHSPRGAKYDDPEYTIVTMLQKKTRSYDFMPPSMTKPFATTTISHLVEMVALMGMFWKAFDELKGNVRAEGNGLILTSTQVHGLGLMATFSKTGRSVFEKNRVIPSDDIKEYVFGCVPCILGGLLEVGPEDISRTLLSYKCSWETVKAFEEKKDRGNIPSVTFELIAMLAKPIRIRGSNFKMLPNPTSDRWVGKDCSIKWFDAMEEFQSRLDDMINNPPASTPHTGPYLEQSTAPSPLITTIQSEWQKMKKVWKRTVDATVECNIDFDIDMREAIHDSLDETRDELLKPSNASRHEITAVFASHIHEVLSASDVIQDEISENTAIPAYLTTRPSTPISASARFINVYFTQILPKITDSLIDGDFPSESVKQKRRAIWATLMFRMIGWFLLHDFDRLDFNLMRSDMKGSRMPVFIG